MNFKIRTKFDYYEQKVRAEVISRKEIPTRGIKSFEPLMDFFLALFLLLLLHCKTLLLLYFIELF